MSLRLVLAFIVVSFVHGTEEITGSDLDVVTGNQVGEEMFTIATEDDPETNVKFGFGFIAEINGAGDRIDEENHFCNFQMDEIACTDEGQTEGFFENAVDADGNQINANYIMLTKTCSLDACNTNANAQLIVKSFIMKNKAYLCQPDCEAEENYQTPVFNGTAKLEIEISDWDFHTDAVELKIFFAIKGQKKGKEMKAKKKDRAAFDKAKGKFADKCKAKEEEQAEEEEEAPAPEESGSGSTKRNAANGAGNRPDGSGQKGQKGDRKGKGKCRNALNTSFNDEPDDQEVFSLEEADDSGTEGSSSIRLFGMAVADGNLLTAGAGFTGPNIVEETFPVGNSQQAKRKQYVAITVTKFNNKLVYDPTVDMNTDGGSNGDPTDDGARITVSLALLFAATLALLNF